MGKMHREFADGISSRPRRIGHVSETRKQKPYSIARRYRYVAIGTDSRSGPLAREELLPVAIKTRGMLGKLRDVRESGIAFADFLPVGSRKLVASITRHLLFCNVSGVRKVGVVYRGF